MLYIAGVLRKRSITISCLTSSQHKVVMDFLLHQFCSRHSRAKVCKYYSESFYGSYCSFQDLSYTMDVLYPEGLKCVLMDMFGISFEQVR